MNMEILDVKEIAKYLRISTKKVYQLIQDNEIPFKKIGGQYRFIQSQVNEWISKSKPNVKDREKKEVITAEVNLQQLLAKAKEIKDKLKKQLFVVAIFTNELAKYKLRPVVVGGFAVEFYTVGGYNTGDIDLVFPDNDLLDKILSKIGFEKKGRHWINKELDIYIEAPGSHLTAGELAHLAEIEIEGLKTYVIGVEDLIIDRLNALVHWKSTDEANWIKELMLISYDKIDWKYLTLRSKEERTYSTLSKLRKEIENAKDKL
jgi:excisionase family DNA binding protein